MAHRCAALRLSFCRTVIAAAAAAAAECAAQHRPPAVGQRCVDAAALALLLLLLLLLLSLKAALKPSNTRSQLLLQSKCFSILSTMPDALWGVGLGATAVRSSWLLASRSDEASPIAYVWDCAVNYCITGRLRASWQLLLATAVTIQLRCNSCK
jgi:hypothetical protein